MRDKHGGDAEPALEARDLDPHLVAQLEVQVRQRFVQQEYGGLDDEGAGERDALPLPARELQRPSLAKSDELHELKRIRDALRDLRLRHVAHAQAKAHVIGHAHVREKCVILEYDANVAPERW